MPLYPRLFAMASAIVGASDAADAVQEAMVKIWASGSAMASIDRPAAYAAAVLRSAAIDMLRSRRATESIDSAREAVAGPEADPDSAEFLERIIATLPETQAEVVRLSAFASMSTEEIADFTGRTPENVRQLLSRGRKKIRELYDKLQL